MNTKIIFRPKEENGKFGFVDQNGSWIINPQYDEVDVFRENVCWVRLNNKWGLIDQNGEFLINPRFDGAREFNEGLANVKIIDKWGVVDKEGKIKIRPEFDYIDSFKDGAAYVKNDGKYGFVFIESNRIIPPIYDDVRGFSEGLAAVQIDGKWGYINKGGEMVVAPDYYYAGKFKKNGRAYVCKDELWGDIDRNGKPANNFEELMEWDDEWSYEDEPWYRDGVRTLHGFIDKEGKFIIKPKFRAATQFNEKGLSLVKIDRKWGIIDTSGAYIIPPRYDDITREADDVIKVRLKDKEWWVDFNENPVDKPPFEDLPFLKKRKYPTRGSESNEDLIPVEIKGKWGFTNVKGEMAIEPKFSSVDDFENGMALIHLNGHCGFIDKEGRYVIKPIFDNIGKRFENGYVRVAIPFRQKYMSRWGVMDINGKYVVPPVYEYIMAHVKEDMARITEGESFGFNDCKTGNEISPIFNYAWDFSGGLAHVRLTEDQIENGVLQLERYIVESSDRLTKWQKEYDDWKE